MGAVVSRGLDFCVCLIGNFCFLFKSLENFRLKFKIIYKLSVVISNRPNLSQ